MTQCDSWRPTLTTQRWILLLLAAVIISLLAGCGGVGTVQNQQPPPQNTITIAYQPQPGASVAVGFSEDLTAVVSNDSQNAGVDWSLTCQADSGNKNGLCGALSALHSASGAPVIYTAPATISGSSTGVQIVAYATAYPSANAVASITVIAFDGTLQAGTYILQAQGSDPYLEPYQFAAAIMLDGNGNILQGEQTVNSGGVSLTDSISEVGSSYFLGNDGRGMITLNTNDNNIGGNGIETFAFVYLSSSKGLISQLDIANAQTGVTAAGTMDLQTSTAAPTGGYAFAVSGTDEVKSLSVAFGGVFSIDSPNTISGNGSVTDEILDKKVNATALGLSGTLTDPDQLGRVTLNLTVPFGSGNKGIPVQLMGYIVDSTHMLLIETDTAAGNAAPFGETGGLAIGQGSATGTFTDSTALSGTYVFGVLGTDLTDGNVQPATLTSVGLLTATGQQGHASGTLSNGFTDTFLQLNCTQLSCTQDGIVGGQISAAFDGSYTVDSSGTGRATLTFGNFNPDPLHDYTPVILLYLTGNGNPPLVLEGGDTHYSSLGVGIAYPQSTAGPAFSGDYGLSFTQENGSENDGTGQMTADPAAQTLSGFADSSINSGYPSLPDQSIGGTLNSPSAVAPFAGTLENSNDSNAFTPGIDGIGFAVNYYYIDPEHGFFVETDLVNPDPGSEQVSFGYYAARTPVCQGCPSP